jgi:hypothetical protein
METIIVITAMGFRRMDANAHARTPDEDIVGLGG